LVSVALVAIALPGCLVSPGDTSQIALVSSSTVSGWRYDFYRNDAYRCAISGHQTFVVARKVGSSDTARAPLWALMHGDSVGWFDSDGSPRPDSRQMIEENAVSLQLRLTNQGLLRNVSESPAGFRLLAVSQCDRDGSGGTGGVDVHNPNLETDGSVHRTNGLQATKAAIQFVQAKYPTSKYFLHGLGDGASGAYLAAYALQQMGNPPAGVVGDSGVENVEAAQAAYQQGVCINARYEPSAAAIVAKRVDESIADSNNEVDKLVARGELTVPLLHVWNRSDKRTCGSTPMQCPMRDGSVRTLGASECMHRPLADAINAKRLQIPSQNMPICLWMANPRPVCRGGNVTTTFDARNNDETSPYILLSAIIDWVGARLAGIGPPPATPTVATGDGHSCAVVERGKVECWGDNTNGQLGDGSDETAAPPVGPVEAVSSLVGDDGIGRPGILTGAVGVVAGSRHTCALLEGGSVKCWGDGSFSAAGSDCDILSDDCRDSWPSPVQPRDASLVALTAGGSHSCAEEAGGALYCWGSSVHGEIGRGHVTRIDRGLVPGVSAPIALAAGESHTCVASGSGAVQCWGANASGQLGNGTTTDSPSPVAGPALAGVADLDAGFAHTCAVVSGGGLKCWGANGSGQLGDGTTTDTSSPVTVAGLTGVSNVVAGTSHTCAVVVGGGVECWGGNDRAQLGDGSTTPSTTPVAVVGVSDITGIDAGAEHACAALSEGGVKCWGSNQFGQLGNGLSDVNPRAPVLLPGVSGVSSLSAGTFHTCVIGGDGAVQCWGHNSAGQLGDGTTTDSTTPVTPAGVWPATAVSAGWGATCAVVTDGAVECWGANASGQLGNGTKTDSTVPVVVSGLSGATAVMTAVTHTCALMADGTIECWGGVPFGSSGDGTPMNSTSPVPVSGISDAVALGVGDSHVCALLADGTVECWGTNNHGQLGNGTTTNSPTPVPVTGLFDALAIDAGGDHSCAVVAGGAVRCWGDNRFGQLGNGTNDVATTPVSVLDVSGSTSVALGARHSCALMAGGAARCWGFNRSGALGNQTFTDQNTPVAVFGLSGAVALSASPIGFADHTCALMADGGVSCWGDNHYGQFGAARGLYLTPVDVIGL